MKTLDASKIIASLSPKDFLFTFESRGNTFLFEELVSAYYMPEGQSVIFFSGDSIRVFSEKGLMKRMMEGGLLRKSEDIKKKIRLLTDLVHIANTEIPIYARKEELKQEDAVHMFGVLASLCREYEYFDPYHWDSVYEKSTADKVMKGNVELVQGFKNEIRTLLNQFYFDKDSYLNILLKKVAEKYGVSATDINLYREKEILALWSGGRVSDSVLRDREKAYVFYKTDASEVLCISGEEARRFVSGFDHLPRKGKETSLKGKVAHGKGVVVRGTVKVISREYGDESIMYRRMDEMKKGDILVSETTEPIMMPAFYKAVAVVTDTGGMLSHAAITARELDLPCIVGTGHASKVLKDGDMIEVDAEKGTVKILND